MPERQLKLEKVPSGVFGLDQILDGGLPKGRPILVAGRAGCGKTVLAMEFLVRGAVEHGEPGVFMTFEETAADLVQNFASLGFDLPDLIARKLVVIDHVRIERSAVEETGDYDLEVLFIRLDAAITAIGAKRVALDTLESLFAGLENEAILRAELRRLFQWLKDRGVTTIITGEAGQGTNITRQGLEEYVSDCVIVLDHRVTDQLSTRRLQVAKYRGSAHGTNEYPFVIDEHGISIMPITSIRADYATSDERVSTGVARLDAMFDGKGWYRGSSVLVSGSAGTGKTTLAAHFADATCARGERCLFMAFEESSSQILRNMKSVGIDLARWVDAGLLRIHAARPTLTGIESHLVGMQVLANDFKPHAVVADSATAMYRADPPG
jgi:circadian clock protein KaiC